MTNYERLKFILCGFSFKRVQGNVMWYACESMDQIIFFKDVCTRGTFILQFFVVFFYPVWQPPQKGGVLC